MRVIALLSIACLWPCPSLIAEFPPATNIQEDQAPVVYLTGQQRQKQNVLATSAWWSDAELRDRLDSFSKRQRIGIFLDRNANPQTNVSLGVNAKTVEQILWKVAGDHGLAVCRIEDLYYFGSPSIVASLPLQMDILKKESLRKRRSFRIDWSRKSKLNTPAVVEPRQLLQKLAVENGFEIEGLDQLPHDLWAGFSLPETSLDCQIQIILAGFNKSFQRQGDGTLIVLVDIPEELSASRNFSLPAGVSGGDAKRLIAQLEQRIKGLQIRLRGKQLSAKGSPSKLMELDAALVEAQQPEGNDTGQKTFSLEKTTAMRMGLLQAIAQQNGLSLSVPDQATAVLQQRITIEVQDATLEELVFEVLKGSGFRGRIGAGKLEVLKSNR